MADAHHPAGTHSGKKARARRNVDAQPKVVPPPKKVSETQGSENEALGNAFHTLISTTKELRDKLKAVDRMARAWNKKHEELLTPKGKVDSERLQAIAKEKDTLKELMTYFADASSWVVPAHEAMVEAMGAADKKHPRSANAFKELVDGIPRKGGNRET